MKPSFSSTKIFSCLLISLILSSCGGYKYQKMESYTQESFAQGKKGVVFFDIAEGSLSKNASLSYILVKLEEKDIRYRVNVNSGFSDFFSLKAFKRNAAQSLLYLDPGIYYIDYISLLDTYNATRWLPSPGYKDNYFLYGAFEIKSGQVVNIGQLVINGDDEIEHVAEICGILNFTNTLELGLDTEIGERGLRISGGQKQRIAIARALLYKPEILLLDEATSALDTESEEQVLFNLREFLAGKTIISVAHRISSIEKADEILVINQGTLASHGTHSQLLRNSKIYNLLYKEQK